MASFPQNNFQQFLQQQPSQPQQSKPLRGLYDANMEGQISQQVAYFNTPNLLNHHPPYIPPFQVAGLVPEENRVELQWNFGLESKKKRPIEQSFLESNLNNNNSNNNSQISSLDLLQARSVSTGLGLSLENPRLTSCGDSSLLGLGADAIDTELQRQDAEIDRYIKLQGDRLRQAIAGKFQATQLQTISYVEEKVMQKLREKEAEVEDMNKKNMELESRIEQLSLESNAWQQRAKCSENTINSLKLNLQQVYAQSRDSKEGCGDSEVDDAASCCNGGPPGVDLYQVFKEGNEMKEMMRCKVCRVNEVCMLLLPCKHLCLCKGCESKLSLCPLCQTSKYIGMEVYM
ncbi:probable BOI-related E3 ubiquitin-protein ligase 2 [Andrographis paniculata]|uniref:probable BOI-related E3 ubiquitin-protein ligase 2 n=1 Tax=Andrographis paniculata TaxID=175694 RepID=UPI0021E919B1|nr:probable BOI-related E3 ubiquitin-protein ligase 2 [Andrographis paniculata]